jgi:hypothetical protein
LPPKGRAWCGRCGGAGLYDGYTCASCAREGHVPKGHEDARVHAVKLSDPQRRVLIELDNSPGNAPMSVAGIAGNLGRTRSRAGIVSVLRTLRRLGYIHVVGNGTAWCRPGHKGSTQGITKAGRDALTRAKE